MFVKLAASGPKITERPHMRFRSRIAGFALLAFRAPGGAGYPDRCRDDRQGRSFRRDVTRTCFRGVAVPAATKSTED